MDRLVWLAIAYIGGAAAILGSFMLLGSLLLWLVPKPQLASNSPPVWQSRLKLIAFSLLLSCVGVGLLIVVRFPK